jgi:hypothetical protein
MASVIDRKAYHNAYNKLWYQRTKETRLKKAKEHYQKWRDAALAGYGAQCSCCGETEYNFLAIDHVNGLTELELSEGRMFGDKLHRFLVKNNFPSEFQVLCHNCNMGRRFNGNRCPHEDQ